MHHLYIHLICLRLNSLTFHFMLLNFLGLVLSFILLFSCIRPCQDNILRMLTCCSSMSFITHMLVYSSFYCIRVTTRQPIECACISLHGSVSQCVQASLSLYILHVYLMFCIFSIIQLVMHVSQFMCIYMHRMARISYTLVMFY